MNHLGEVDRGAILLHFFENKRLREVGTALGMTEDTAQKRVSRAVEKLRKLLFKRGVVLPAVALPGLLMTRAVSAAPAQLTTKVTAAGLNQTVLPTSVCSLLEQCTPWIGLPSAKTTAIVMATILVVGGGAAVSGQRLPRVRQLLLALQNTNSRLGQWQQDSPKTRQMPSRPCPYPLPRLSLRRHRPNRTRR